MRSPQQIVEQMMIDPAEALENLKKAAIQYARAIEAKDDLKNNKPAPFPRRI
jgi:hypothetical protein